MIGLSTYAYFWQMSDRVEAPIGLREAFEDTRAQGVELFQICDHRGLLAYDRSELAELAAIASDLELTVELGTRGVQVEHLQRHLEIAEVFGATLLRSMITPDVDLDRSREILRQVLPDFERAGVSLALETYEQIGTADLVGLVTELDSSHLGICLDPANVVARLENPRQCVETVGQTAINVHVKDFAFDRQPGWVGFTYSGAAMGSGLHDYRHLLTQVRPRERGVNEVVEHWLPWQETPEQTVRAEREWTRTTIDYLKGIA